MTHDPLCLDMTVRARHRHERGVCYCDLIARVAERERGRTYGWPDYLSQRDRDVRAAALRDATAAVKALDDGKTVPPNDGYAEAVAAITALGGER